MPRSIARRFRCTALWLTAKTPFAFWPAPGERIERLKGRYSRAAGPSAQRAVSRTRRKKIDTSGSGVLRLLGCQFELVRHSAQLGKRTGLHLVHQTAAMHLHGGFGNADIAGNLLAEAAVRDLNHDLAFPGAQRLEAFP